MQRCRGTTTEGTPCNRRQKSRFCKDHRPPQRWKKIPRKALEAGRYAAHVKALIDVAEKLNDHVWPYISPHLEANSIGDDGFVSTKLLKKHFITSKCYGTFLIKMLDDDDEMIANLREQIDEAMLEAADYLNHLPQAELAIFGEAYSRLTVNDLPLNDD